MTKWYCGEGNNSDVVMSSSIRLARNLDDAPFPNRMSDDIRKNACKKIFACVKNSDYAGEFDLMLLSDMTADKAMSYAKRGIISEEFANTRGGAFIISKSENVSIMLCEEDHIRIVSKTAGQDLAAAYDIADKLDDVFIKNLHIAYNDELGFLTAMPTNLGTGLKASFDLHLPAIDAKGMTSQLASMVGKLGMTLRPLYDSDGSFYRLTNQVSLGITEQNSLDNLNAICDQIVKQERTLREYYKSSDEYQDMIFRALGTMTMARRMTEKEFYDMASLVRVGISMGFVEKPYSVIGDLMDVIATPTIISRSQADITPEEVSKIRAKIVREKLK